MCRMSASTRRKPPTSSGQKSSFGAEPIAAEPGDLDRAVVLDDRRPRLVVDAEHLHPRPELGLRRREGAHVRLDPAGGRRIVLAQMTDAQRLS